MKRFIKSKKGIALLATLVVAAAAAVGAYAYLTSAGSGSGTAQVGANTTSIHLLASITNGLVPGSSEPVSFKAYNTSTTTTGYVGTISLVSVTDPGGAAGCISYLAANQSDFTFTTNPVTENTAVPANTTSGTAVSMPTGDTLNWANSSTVDQTPCIGETLTVNVSSS